MAEIGEGGVVLDELGSESGFACSFCGSQHTKTTDTRWVSNRRRRRRVCKSCGKRFTTYEITAEQLGLVYQRALNHLANMVVDALKADSVDIDAILGGVETHGQADGTGQAEGQQV